MQCVQKGIALAKGVQNTPMFWAFPLTISYCGLVAKCYGYVSLMEEAIVIMQRYLPRFPLTLRMIDILLSSPVPAYPPPPPLPNVQPNPSAPSKLAVLLDPNSPAILPPQISTSANVSSVCSSIAFSVHSLNLISSLQTDATTTGTGFTQSYVTSAFTRANIPRPHAITRAPFALPVEANATLPVHQQITGSGAPPTPPIEQLEPSTPLATLNLNHSPVSGYPQTQPSPFPGALTHSSSNGSSNLIQSNDPLSSSAGSFVDLYSTF